MSDINCPRCNAKTPAANAEYALNGELVCRDCAIHADAERNLEEAEHQSGMRGGLLDRVFLSRLNKTGKTMYFAGQLVAVAALLYAELAHNNVELEDIYVPIILSGLGIVIVWGIICTAIWPRKTIV